MVVPGYYRNQDNRNVACWIDGKCTKGYPKKFRETKLLNVDGFPEYRRQNTGLFQIRNQLIDNR